MRRMAATRPRPDGRLTLGSAPMPCGVGICPADQSGPVVPTAAVFSVAFSDTFDSAALIAFAFMTMPTLAE